MGIRCVDQVTPLYPQKLALTSPTGGGRSVGIVHSRTEATEFELMFKNLILKQQKTRRLSIIKTSRLILFKSLLIFYFGDRAGCIRVLSFKTRQAEYV